MSGSLYTGRRRAASALPEQSTTRRLFISVVEVYVSKVRKKLKGTVFAENLQTLRSVGYILKHV